VKRGHPRLVLKVCRVRGSWLQKRRFGVASVLSDPARCGEIGTKFSTNVGDAKAAGANPIT
jgi:hypothetical protein